MDKTIVCNVSVEGFHNWPDAPVQFEYLRSKHRHMFNIELHIPVTDSNREIEFIEEQRIIKELLLLSKLAPILSLICISLLLVFLSFINAFISLLLE